MAHLHQALREAVDHWREANYANGDFPAIAEILQYAIASEVGSLRYLRQAQFRALETYWYLRLQLDTPTVPELYRRLFPKQKDRLAAMGISHDLFAEADFDFDTLIEQVLTDNALVRRHKLESLRETLRLDYPSYILALAMGAGKTILMGAIVATEFAMAHEYPEGPFVQNALIFAPGKTIIESLRELADVPYQQILPPRLHRPFSASLKLSFTRDGDKELPVVWGSSWNLIVTNTEKIRIQKKTRRKHRPQLALQLTGHEDDHDAEEANLRLQAIASLPHLAVFSDEAHHTYGQKLLGKWQTNKETGDKEFVGQGIKKVRRTVDYLAEATNLIVVVNTTGTPYFERQPLRDVVIWYGLGEGIADGVLKELANNVQIFDLDETESPVLVGRIVSDFVDDYWGVALPDGAPARLALYFPNTAALDELRPAVDSALAGRGHDPACVLAVHSKSSSETKSEFYRVANDPASPYRIILLVNMGTEGWNCPSLFACGLVRRLKTSNNFVLQAATRCLRQVPGNERPARVYVSKGNKAILSKQLEETFGTTLGELSHQQAERVEKTIELRQPELPRLILRKKVRRFVRVDNAEQQPLQFSRPEIEYPKTGVMQTWTIAEPKDGRSRLTRVDGGEDNFELEPLVYSLHGAAAELAANYHLPANEIIDALRVAYANHAGIPEHHLPVLGEQIEQQRADYTEDWHEIDVALALVKPEGFSQGQRNGLPVYTAKVSFAKDRAHLYQTADQLPDAEQARALSFHYEGYNFDSQSEAEYFERVLNLVKQHPDNIDGIWFTGGLTDPNKTELYAEYLGDDGRWHRYTPDFVIRRKDGRHLIVEVKSDALSAAINQDLDRHAKGERPLTPEGRKAVALKRWEALNPDVLHYQVIFADTALAEDALDETRAFVTKVDGVPA
jgi:hypothetical protein